MALVATLTAIVTVSPCIAKPLDMVQLAPGVYVHQGQIAPMTLGNRGNIANIGFVVGNRSVAVIDTGGSVDEANDLIEAIHAATDKPISHVVLTHMHPDHIFGSAAFMRPDVAFVGHARLNAAILARFDYYKAANLSTLGARLMDQVAKIQVTTEVTDSLDIDLGDRVLSLRAWPIAHTDNDLTVFDRQSGILFTGDLVFTHHTPSLDGSLLGWQKVLDQMALIPAKAIVPGHGPIGAPWPEAMQPERHYLDKLASDIRAALKAGKSMAETVETAGASEAGKWMLFDDYNKRNATAAYAELEWQ